MSVNHAKTIHHHHHQLSVFVFHVIFRNITAMYTIYFILLTFSDTLAQTESAKGLEENLIDAFDVFTTAPVTTLPTTSRTSSTTMTSTIATTTESVLPIDLQRECHQDVCTINFKVDL